MKKVLWGLTKISFYGLSLLPFPILYLISDLFYLLLYHVVRYRREVVMTNLRNSFPERSEQALKVIEKKYFRFLCDNILESFKMLSMSKEEVRKRLKFVNPEEIERHFKNGRCVLGTGGHYANWEWGNLAIKTYFEETIMVIYKPLANKEFGDFMNKMRSRFGTIMVPMKQTLRKISEHKNERFLMGFVSDQTPTRHESQYFTTFLNQPTAVFLGIEKIARLTNSPVIFYQTDRVKRGYYQVTITTLFEEPRETAEYEITEAHTRKLEEYIREKPELWLWSHKRWKFKPEDTK